MRAGGIGTLYHVPGAGQGTQVGGYLGAMPGGDGGSGQCPGEPDRDQHEADAQEKDRRRPSIPPAPPGRQSP
jgi:hypothetical protein